MSQPAALSGAAYSRTASTVCSPASISGTSSGHGDGGEAHARVEGADEGLVAAGGDRRLGGEQADPAVAGGADGGGRLGRDHADDRDAERGLERRQRGRGGGVAGDDDQLHALALEVGGDLVGEPRDLGERPRAVGEPRVVAEVDEVLVRHRDQALVENREAADAGVEDTDRPRVHAGDSMLGG